MGAMAAGDYYPRSMEDRIADSIGSSVSFWFSGVPDMLKALDLEDIVYRAVKDAAKEILNERGEVL